MTLPISSPLAQAAHSMHLTTRRMAVWCVFGVFGQGTTGRHCKTRRWTTEAETATEERADSITGLLDVFDLLISPLFQSVVQKAHRSFSLSQPNPLRRYPSPQRLKQVSSPGTTRLTHVPILLAARGSDIAISSSSPLSSPQKPFIVKWGCYIGTMYGIGRAARPTQ